MFVNPLRVADQPVGDVVAHLMKRDQRFMIAGAAGLRAGADKFIHLHAGAGAIGGGRHVGVVGAAEVVAFGEDRVAADAAAPEVVLLRIARCFVKTGLVPAVVQPVDVKEHPHETVLQILWVAGRLGVIVR